jgi:transcriptional regulator with XRE-family HTH domain
VFSIQNTLKLHNADDAVVAGKVSKKLKYKRKAETLKQAIGAVVTQLRVERNWPQAELSVRSGYGRPWISQLENGKVNPRLELIIAFADTFKLTLSQFFARAERKHLKRKPAAPVSSKPKKKS